MSKSVKIQWYPIDLHAKITKKSVNQELVKAGAPKSHFDRATYVVRLKSPFSIMYPEGYSPTMYIGEGNIIERLYLHREWIRLLLSLGYEFPIEALCSFPRLNGAEAAYKNFEAHLLDVFFEKYGSLPLKNSNHETKKYDHLYAKVATHGIIGPGSGTKYKWAIQPLPSNPFNNVFKKTHAAK